MSEEQYTAEEVVEDSQQDDSSSADRTPDELTNFKQEISRKFGNFESKVDRLSQTNQELLNRLSEMSKPSQPATSQEDYDDLWLDNPKEAAKRIKEETAAEIRAEIDKQQKSQQAQNRVLSQLVQSYPEINNASHNLTKRAVEIYNSLEPAEQQDPKSYRLAVTEAAAELGIKPAHRRKKEETTEMSRNDDNFSVSGTKGSKKPGKNRLSEGEDLDPRTIDFAKMVGLDTDNEQVLERLKKRAQRKNWGRYE